MSTGTQPSPISDLTTFTTQLNGLCPDQSPNDLSDALRAAFKQRELYGAYVSSLVGDVERIKMLLEVFDKALKAATHNDTMFKRFRQLCGLTGLLPTSHIIPGELIQTTEYPVASGGFGDVWEGIYNEKPVAIKVFRVYKDEDVQKVRKVFCKEVVMWKRISHPNIVPFLGVSEALAPLSMVSEWMSNGNVRDYVGKKPETSRLQLLLDVSRGLSFLHSLDIVHGDLKGDNILVDKSGYARLVDFGFTIIAGLDCTETSASKFRGSYRWMAPELFNIGTEGASGLSTCESDVFALGMVTFEVFTGQVPFSECEASAAVMKRITDGKRPSRPPKGKELGLSDLLWEIVQSSLASEVAERPPVSTFVDFFEKASPSISTFEELAQFDAHSEDDIKKFRCMFEYGDNTLLGMRENETLVVIEVFDRILDSSLDDRTLRNQCLYGLQKVAARCGLLPKSYWVSHSSLAEPSGTPSAIARVSNTCQWLINGELMAVKTISLDRIKNFKTLKHRLYTNAVVWKQLRHPNLLSFLGFGSDSPFSLVYPWMPNGSLSNYVRKHPDVDRLHLLSDVTHGLTYLHWYGLVHGNLTGHNILVDGGGVACISEYGLEIILHDKTSSKSAPTNARWMAPEVPGIKSGYVPSGDSGKAADVYSLAMIMFEVLSGTAPFPNESDEEIVHKVTIGSRPERPSNNPPNWLVDELWKQIEVCWSQQPNVRPTASKVLQALLALGKAHHQEPVVSVEGSDDEAEMWGWEITGDDREEMPPTHEERREPHNSYDQSGGTHKSDRSRRPFRKKVGKYVRSIFHSSRHTTVAVTTTTETVRRREEVVKKPTLGTEIIDQREEEVIVRDDCIPYVISRPIPEGKTLRKVVITVVSKDQGWSDRLDDYGTYRNSWTWFELSVGSASKDPGERWRGLVVRNLHAHSDFKEHTIEITDGKLYEKAKSGDVLTVWALARFSGWKNTVKKVTIRYVVG